MKLLLVLLFVASASAAKPAPLLRSLDPVTGSYIIKIKASFNVSSLADSPVISVLGGLVTHRYQHVFHGFAANLSESALKLIRVLPMVESVEEDGVVRTSYAWGIDRVNQRLPLLDYNTTFTIGSQGAGANVFVLDTGVNTKHPQFGERARAPVNFVDDGRKSGSDCHGHGTHCSGIIGSADYGVATEVNIVGVRVNDCEGNGAWSQVIKGCDYVVSSDLPNKVASLSLSGTFSQSVNDAVKSMVESNVAVAVAAGNEYEDACYRSPGGEDAVLTVGATEKDDTRAWFSNYGVCVDIFAPGVDILSTWLWDDLKIESGTSMATPHVAGVMALLRVEYPDENAVQIMERVKDAATENALPLLYSP